MTTRLVTTRSAAAAGILIGLLLTGCAESTVTGTPEASSGSVTPGVDSEIPGPLSALLIDPQTFPDVYEALVLPEQAAAAATQDLDGIAAGASVVPAGCAPPSRSTASDGLAVVVGTDGDTRSTITVELERVDAPLSDRKSVWEQCPTVEATSNGVTSTVTTELSPPPPIDADDSAALRRTVTSGAGPDTVTQSTLSLVAQIDDVRITATFMSYTDAAPDAVTLDELFTAAVLKVGAAR